MTLGELTGSGGLASENGSMMWCDDVCGGAVPNAVIWLSVDASLICRRCAISRSLMPLKPLTIGFRVAGTPVFTGALVGTSVVMALAIESKRASLFPRDGESGRSAV